MWTGWSVERFHSRGLQLYKYIETEEGFYRRKRFHSQTIGLEHQHGRRFIVLGHQYGRCDVMHVKTFYIEKKQQQQRILVVIVVINDEWKHNKRIFHIYYYTNTFRFRSWL